LGFDLNWLDIGIEQVFECRRILAYSYVFAFYLFGEETAGFSTKVNKIKNKIHQTLFEDHQEQLELTTERINKLLTLPYEEFMKNPKIYQDVMNLTVNGDKRCKALFDIIIADILDDNSYGIDISHYKSRLVDSSSHITTIAKVQLPPPPEEKNDDDLQLV